MNQIKLKALAKVNLGLDVIKKREDGYHEVRMIMQTIKLYDRIVMEKSKEPGIHLKTNLSYLPVNENNLVYKGVQLIKDEFDIKEGISIELEKYIPVAAGMAGGSSDAAASLVGMNRLFGLNLNKRRLMELGIKLGADVPYCVLRGTALSEGIGEILTPLPKAPRCRILVAKPAISVSTGLVYENLKIGELAEHPDIDGMIKAIKENDLYGVADRLSNVLETVSIKEYPVIQKIKQKMVQVGAMNALMSGSGPTVFGLFDNENKAKTAYDIIKNGNLAKQVFLTEFY